MRNAAIRLATATTGTAKRPGAWRPHLFALQILMAVFLLSTPLYAQESTVLQKSVQPEFEEGAARLEPNDPAQLADLEVGEAVKVRVTVPGDGEIENIELKLNEEQAPKAVVESVRKIAPSSFEVTFRALGTGPYEIGPATIVATPEGSDSTITLTTTALSFNVTAPELASEEPELRDYTGPLAMTFDYTLRNIVIASIVLVALLAIIALIAALVVYLNRKRAVAEIEPILSPVDSALLSVRGLSSLDIFRAQGGNAHYTKLSESIRRYLERQFRTNAVELSEDEVVELINYHLDRIPRVADLVDVLRRSSLAKYANRELSEEEAQQDCLLTLRFLEGEKQRIDDSQRLAAKNSPAAGRSEDRAA